jgi:3-hydroxyisobutyrate dehydrogenase-like beta-hydroxyacid dehydrogenase
MPTIGLIGLGNMGRGIGKNILEAGMPLSVMDTSQETVAQLRDLGAREATSMSDMVAESEVILTCLPSLASVRQIYLGEGGIVDYAGVGKTAVDCSTATPVLAQEIGAALGARQMSFLDAPMLKTPQAAWDGTLHLVVGGDGDTLERVRPVLETISEKIVPAGALGNGQAMKLINNAMTLGTHVVVCEALTLARKLDVDLSAMLAVGDASMASSNKLRELAPRLIADDHSLSFATDVALKDLTAFSEMAQAAGAMIPACDAARDLMRLTSGAGYGAANVSRVATILADAADTKFGD